MNAFTIKDLENLSGIKAHTIRIWEQRYSFLKPKRSTTNIRYYESEELKTILNIALLNKYGFKISQIDKMSADTIKQKILSLNTSEAQQERIINSLMHCMIELNSQSFEEILDEYILANGIDKTISFLVFPFLQKIGILWQTDHIRIAQEHLVSNIIRQKLIMGIENASNLQIGKKTVVMYLPQNEHHEIGLLYVLYLLKIRGTKIIYLGADVPLDELEFVVKIKKPDFVYSHLTSVSGRFSFEKYLAVIGDRLASFSFIFSGRIVQTYPNNPPKNIVFLNSLKEVVNTLAD